MTTAPVHFTMRQYQHLVEALSTQHRLGCRSVSEAAETIRRFLVAQMGVRQFLGSRLNGHARESAEGWQIEFDYGRRRVPLGKARRTLMEALTPVLEECWLSAGEWPTGVCKGDTYIAL